MKSGSAEFLRVIILAGACIMVSAGQPAAEGQEQAGADKKGLVTYVEGTTKKQKIGAEEWDTAAQNTEVVSGERVKTFRRSRAELELAKLDVVRLAPLTTLEINKLYEESKEKAMETDLTVTEGDVWAEVSSVGDDASFALNSPVVGNAIRGTVLRINVNDDKSTEVRVYTGEVAVTNKPAGKNSGKKARAGEVSGPVEIAGPREVSFEEWVYIVKNMQKIRISASGKIDYSGEFSEKDKEEQTDWVQWNRSRSRKLNKKKGAVPATADSAAAKAPAVPAPDSSSGAGSKQGTD